MKDMLLKPVAPPPAAVPPEEFHEGMRVFDKVVAVFNHACAAGHFEAAEELLAVLEKVTERRIRRFGGNRRKESFTVEHAREHLAWERANRVG